MVYQFQDNNNQNPTKQANYGNYQRILDIIKRNPSSRDEIKRELANQGITDITRQGIINHINKLVAKKEVRGIRKIKRPKDYKDVLKRTSNGKNWKKSINIYYFQTPSSSKFYGHLQSLIENLPKKGEHQTLIDDICNNFSAIEIVAKYENTYMRNAQKDIHNFSKKNINITISGLKDRTIKVGEKEYLRIGSNLVPYSKLERFLNLPRKYMTDIMFWTSSKTKENRETIFLPLMLSMVKLFIETEKDSQLDYSKIEEVY